MSKGPKTEKKSSRNLYAAACRLRRSRRPTIATSQFPVDTLHTTIGDATLGDAILDRILHNAYKITLKGESMRKRQAKLLDYSPPKSNETDPRQDSSRHGTFRAYAAEGFLS